MKLKNIQLPHFVERYFFYKTSFYNMDDSAQQIYIPEYASSRFTMNKAKMMLMNT